MPGLDYVRGNDSLCQIAEYYFFLLNSVIIGIFHHISAKHRQRLLERVWLPVEPARRDRRRACNLDATWSCRWTLYYRTPVNSNRQALMTVTKWRLRN